MARANTPTVEVFWRPGCTFCLKLWIDLALRRVDATWRNIWTDEEARAIVREVNGGAETVPTVRIGGSTLVNPGGGTVKRLVEPG